MKKIFYIALCAIFFASCSDKVYEELNTDPTKAQSLEPSYQLSYAEMQIFGDMNYVDVHRLYTYAFTQHLMGCWNTTNYGGQHRMDDNEMCRPWNNLYTGAFRNLTDAIYYTKDDPKQANIYAALRIFRVYVGALLTDYYGDIPFTQAGLGQLEKNSKPRYDTQEELYKLFFTELKQAAALFDISADPIESDPLFNGDIDKWRVFANSLRLRYAMRLAALYEQDPSSEIASLAVSQFQDALNDGVMLSAAENACVTHQKVSYSFGQESYKDFRGNALAKYFYGNDPANNPSYLCETFWKTLYENKDPRTTLICGFYIDDYMSISSGEGRIDMTEAVLQAQTDYPEKDIISTVAPGEFSWDNWPSYPSLPAGNVLDAKVAEVKAQYPAYDEAKNPRWLKPKLANNMLRSQNPGVLMTYAEVCFLRAEAAVLGWTGDNAKQMYETGIRAAMDFVADYYGYDHVLDADFAAYIAQPVIAFGAGPAQQKSQINTQAWILHFHNPAEAWSNQRRSNIPVLTPPDPNGKNKLIDGKEIPLRLCYPLKEETYSAEAYEEAKARVAGGYSWHAPLWWDVQ